jgi:MFS transporter, DHA1 family, multidrug resistance protein
VLVQRAGRSRCDNRIKQSVNQTAERAFERRILIWMCVLIAINQLGFGALVPVMPLYAKGFGVSQMAIGMAIAIYGLARFVMGVPTGQLADWLGRRPTLAIGGLVSTAGNFWCACADTYPEFVIARFVAGAGAALVLNAGSIVLADITTPERRGRSMAIYQGTFLFAVGAGPFPGGVIAQAYGLSAPFIAYGIAGLGASAVAWFAISETRDFRRSTGSSGAVKVRFGEQLRIMLSQLGFRLVSAVGFTNAFTRTGALFTLMPLIATELIGLSATQIGAAMAIGSVLGLLATYPSGVLLDRYGRKAVIVPATILSGASMALFYVAPNFSWFVGASILWGVASSIGGAAPAAYAADSAPEGMNAAAMSCYRTLSDLGYVLGPVLLGLLADLTGAGTALLVSAVMLITIGALFARFAPETHRPGN